MNMTGAIMQEVSSELSAQYWIISAGEASRECEKECMQSKREKAILAEQIVALLPELRTRMLL